jgi:hypothetical protein
MEPSKCDGDVESPQSLSWIIRHQKNVLYTAGTSTDDREVQSCVCAYFRTESVHMYTEFKHLLMALIIKIFHFRKGLSKTVNSAITRVSSSPRQFLC